MYVTVKEACNMLKVGKTYLYRQIKEGKLKAVHLSTTKFIIDTRDIEDFITSIKNPEKYVEGGYNESVNTNRKDRE